MAGEGRAFSSVAEAIMAFDRGELDLQSNVKLRLDDIVPPARRRDARGLGAGSAADPRDHPGPRAVQRGAAGGLPVRRTTRSARRALGGIVNDLAERYTKVEVAATLDALKDTGFHWATRSGVTISIEDVVTPAEARPRSSSGYEGQAEKVQSSTSAA